MITITPTNILPTQIETVEVDDSILIKLVDDLIPPLIPPTLDHIDVVFSSEMDLVVDIDLADSEAVVNIYGKPRGVFTNRYIRSVSKGSSDIYETVRVDVNFEAAQGREIISVSPDPRQSVTVDITLTVFLSDDTSEQFTLTKTFNQSYQAIKTFIQENT